MRARDNRRFFFISIVKITASEKKVFFIFILGGRCENRAITYHPLSRGWNLDDQHNICASARPARVGFLGSSLSAPLSGWFISRNIFCVSVCPILHFLTSFSPYGMFASSSLRSLTDILYFGLVFFHISFLSFIRTFSLYCRLNWWFDYSCAQVWFLFFFFFQGILVQEIDEGRPCLSCGENCSGFQPHQWR